MTDKKIFCQGQLIQQLKSYRSCSFHVVLMRYILLNYSCRVHKLTTKERMDGRTNMVSIGRSFSTGRAMC